MGEARPSFRRGAVRPMECWRGGWELVRGRYWLFVGIAFVGVLIGSLAPMYILWGPMVCGIQVCLLRAVRGRPVKFESLFKGFDYFVQSLVATLIWAVPLYVIMLLAYLPVIVIMFSFMKAGPPAPGAGPGFLKALLGAMAVYLAVALVATFVVTVLTTFLYPLIVDRKMSGVAALKTSAQAAMGNLGGLLGLVLVNYLFMFVGALACYVGAIFVLPVHFASITVAYRKVFPDDEYFEPPKPTPEELDYDEQPDLDVRPPERRDDGP